MKPSSLLGVAALSAAALLLESALTRLLAVAQFYHFAFLIVSLALLGFGASGTFLSLQPGLLKRLTPPMEDTAASGGNRLLAAAGAGFTLSLAAAYLAVNLLPFDSYRIAYEWQQVLYFVLYYLALGLPFFCSGVGIGYTLALQRGRSHIVYAANLLGSAVGVLLAPALLALAGVPGALLASGMIALLPAALPGAARPQRTIRRWPVVLVWAAGLAVFAALSAANLQDRSPTGITISPYKGLPLALHQRDARALFGRWNAISRVDVVASESIHILPGLSYTYPGWPPAQNAIFIDADAPLPVTDANPQALAAADYLPEAAAFHLRPGARVLALEPGGGLGVLQALAGGASQVTALSGNPLLWRAAAQTTPGVDVFASPQVRLIAEDSRVYLHQSGESYDIIFLPLTDAYRPVANGAYSLAETYTLTVEAFSDALARLQPQGILVVSRWLQTPPSESIRLIATLAEALEQRGAGPAAQRLAAYRGIQTMTVLVKPSGWDAGELERIRTFAQQRRYDLVWAPDIQPAEVNRYNRLPEPVYYETVRTLLAAQDRSSFYAAYPFDITPRRDDRPFFFHFFSWQQTPQILAALGRTWQPFGGSGYFVLLALLAMVLLLSGVLILAPLARSRSRPAADAAKSAAATPPHTRLAVFVYFALLGLAYLLIEIPLIQRWILLLGRPVYAFTAVVLAFMLFSGLGSMLAAAPWLPRRAALGVLTLLALAAPFLVPHWIDLSLGWPLWQRMLSGVLILAPLALLMGLPFPLGLAWLENEAPALVPWAWAINGCASVTASVLAAILSLGYGFTAVLLLGAAAYAGAWLVSARYLTSTRSFRTLICG